MAVNPTGQFRHFFVGLVISQQRKIGEQMPQVVIDWSFSAASVANPDGRYRALTQQLLEVPGPGETAIGSRPKALKFGPGASCQVQVPPGEFDATRFAIRMAFRVTEAVTTRNNLLESTSLPCAMWVEPGPTENRFNLVASVANGDAGWIYANSANRISLERNQFYVASVVYDQDTLMLMVGDTVVAVTATPAGGLSAPSGDKFFVGTWVDGVRWPFFGEIAGLQVWKDIPEALEARLDAERGGPEWHLSRKETSLRNKINLGPKTADFYYDPATASYIQPYAIAIISFTEAHGAAFVMYGAILDKWRSDENLRRSLGALASDEMASRAQGTSRKSVFTRGCIYFSANTGPVPVLDRMYLDYEMIGEGSSMIGLPTAPMESIPGGKVQQFERGRMFWRNGASNAFAVHGEILAKFEQAGGVNRFGFPVSHSSEVRQDGRSRIGFVSEFELCTIYRSPNTPASVIYGGIRDQYRGAPGVPGEGGPLGHLGFPTSDESDVPGAPGARYNTFQNGSIVWFGGPTFVCRPFNVHLGVLDTREEDRDLFDADGQNDLYCRVRLKSNGSTLFDRRFPDSGHFPSANVRDLQLSIPYTAVPNSPGFNLEVEVQVWETDDGQIFSGAHAKLGTITHSLNMANAWGFRDGTNGLFTAAQGPWINRLDWSVKPKVTPQTPLDFWGAQNQGTKEIGFREYAAAFSDVDPDFEIDFGIIDDGLKRLFYEIVKGSAANGNCFGMSLEAIYAYKERSRMARPLARFTSWPQIERDFNIKHLYQVGADAIWWFVGQFLSGATHDPVRVFNSTWEAFLRGENPVICLAERYEFFGGALHCVMPISWNTSRTPWEIEIFDPNSSNAKRTISVDPATNRFRYVGDGVIYEGDEWSGGRLYYTPWPVLNHQQRTPVWDAILLLLGGGLLIFGDSVDVESLTDEQGRRLDSGSVRKRADLKGKLVRIAGSFGSGPIRGGLFAGRFDQPVGKINPALMRKMAIRSDAAANNIPGHLLLQNLRQDPSLLLRPMLGGPSDNIQARLKGNAKGKFESYHKRGLLGVHVTSDVQSGEQISVGFDRIGSRSGEVQVQSDRNRTYEISFTNKLGAGKDFIKVSLAGLPAAAGQPVKVSTQPGLASIDLMTQGAQADLRIRVEGVVDGRELNRSFTTQVENGQRLKLPDLNGGPLQTQKIDRLLGPGRGVRIIR